MLATMGKPIVCAIEVKEPTDKCNNHHPIIPPQPAASTGPAVDSEPKKNTRNGQERPYYDDHGLNSVHNGGKTIGKYRRHNSRGATTADGKQGGKRRRGLVIRL